MIDWLRTGPNSVTMRHSSKIKEHKSVEVSGFGVFIKRVPAVPATIPVRYVHRDDYYMFGLIEGGECTLTIDSEPHRFQTGEAFFILPGQTHGFAGATELKACILMVDTAFVGQTHRCAFDTYASARHSVRPDERRIGELLTLFDLIARRIDDVKNDGSKELLHQLAAVAAGIIAELLEEAEARRSTARNRQTELLQTFRALVRSESHNEHRPSYYAARLNITPGYLNEVVKAATGLNCMHYIRQTLLSQAKKALVHTDKHVRQIGFELGFHDQAYFTRLFTRHVGSTPSQFRANNRN